jgi:carboxyl-terminal processing protease
MNTGRFALSARWPASILLLALSACGGGGDDDGGGGGGGGGGIGGGYTPGTFQPSSTYAAHCVSPRSGINPATGRAYPDVSGSTTDQNNWLRSWTNELYLWYREVPDLNPAQYATPAYFDLLKTSGTAPSGAAKDRFHFTYSTPEWQALSGSGQEVGYGVQWALISTTPPRRAVIAYLEPSVPSATGAANLSRGVEILTVDGTDLVNDNTTAGVDKINAGMFPEASGESHAFRVRELNGTIRDITLQSAVITSAPVPVTSVLSTPSGQVGYLLFNDHIATSEVALFNAITTLKNAGVTNLVLDIRYNGGGFLDIASELAYMIAGTVPTSGRSFELIQFNDKHPTTNPVTGRALAPTPFHTRSQGFSSNLPENTTLPTLNLNKVYVLTGNNTCSASESIINGLRGVDVQVIQIGSTTCGKPYGFYPTDNCGTTYFSIQFRGVNAKNFGDYADGFSPSSAPMSQSQLPGCSVPDDFTQPLGNTAENRLQVALAHIDTGQCVAFATASALGAVEAVVPKAPWRTNRILRD